MTNKPTDDSIPLSAESFQHLQEILDNPAEPTQALIDLLREDDDTLSTEAFKSLLKLNLKSTIKIDGTEDKDLHLYADLFSTVHSALSVQLKYISESEMFKLTHSVVKTIVESWLPNDQLNNFDTNVPRCSEFEQPAPITMLQTQLLSTEEDFAYSYHCNIAMPICDILTRDNKVDQYTGLVIGNACAKSVMYQFFGKQVVEHYEEMIPVRDEVSLEPGQALYADYIAVNAVHSDALDNLVPWDKLTQDQQLIWTRTAVAYSLRN